MKKDEESIVLLSELKPNSNCFWVQFESIHLSLYLYSALFCTHFQTDLGIKHFRCVNAKLSNTIMIRGEVVCIPVIDK